MKCLNECTITHFKILSIKQKYHSSYNEVKTTVLRYLYNVYAQIQYYHDKLH